MKFNITSESYLPWEEYSKLIQEKESLVFITNTAKENLRNILTKEVK